MIMGPHHMAPSEHGHVRARVGGIMPSRDRVSAPSLQEGPSLLVLGGVWQPRPVPIGMFKDLTLVGLHWCIPAAAQLCYARLQQKGPGSMVCEVLGLP